MLLAVLLVLVIGIAMFFGIVLIPLILVLLVFVL